MSKALLSEFFFAGTFVTSFGSLLFLMLIPAFFVSYDYPTEIIGLTIGIHRLLGIFALTLFGPNIDQFDSRKVVLLTEFFSSLASLGLIVSWACRDSFGLSLFWVFLASRAFTVGIQSSSRNRLIKLLVATHGKTHKEANYVIWLNKVTQGAHLLAAIVATPLLLYGNFTLVMVIDGLSFIIGGYSVLQLQDIDKKNKGYFSCFRWIASAKYLIKTHPIIFVQDQLLALATTGTILLVVKLSNENSNYIVYFNFIYGCTIWLSSLIAHHVSLRERTIPYWGLMCFGFAFLSLCWNTPIRFFAFFIIFMGYWVLFHKYTAEIQVNTPLDRVGSTMSVRNLIMLFTLSIGEFAGGYITRVVSIPMELVARSIVCLSVVAFLSFAKFYIVKDHR